jgi:hypothetical protein
MMSIRMRNISNWITYSSLIEKDKRQGRSRSIGQSYISIAAVLAKPSHSKENGTVVTSTHPTQSYKRRMT